MKKASISLFVFCAGLLGSSSAALALTRVEGTYSLTNHQVKINVQCFRDDYMHLLICKTDAAGDLTASACPSPKYSTDQPQFPYVRNIYTRDGQPFYYPGVQLCGFVGAAGTPDPKNGSTCPATLPTTFAKGEENYTIVFSTTCSGDKSIPRVSN